MTGYYGLRHDSRVASATEVNAFRLRAFPLRRLARCGGTRRKAVVRGIPAVRLQTNGPQPFAGTRDLSRERAGRSSLGGAWCSWEQGVCERTAWRQV